MDWVTNFVNVVTRPEISGRTTCWSKTWLLMLCPDDARSSQAMALIMCGQELTSSRKDLNCLHHLNDEKWQTPPLGVWRNDGTYKYMLAFSKCICTLSGLILIWISLVTGMSSSGVLQHGVAIQSTDSGTRTRWAAPIVECACAATQLCCECRCQTAACFPCHHGNDLYQCNKHYWEYANRLDTNSQS